MKNTFSFYCKVRKQNKVTIPSRIIHKYFPNLKGGYVFLLKVRNVTFYSRVSYQNLSYSLYLPMNILKTLNIKIGDKIKLQIMSVIRKNLTISDVARLNYKIHNPLNLVVKCIQSKYKFVKVINGVEYVNMEKLIKGKISLENRNIYFIIKSKSSYSLFVSYKFEKRKKYSKREFGSICIKKYIPLYDFVQFLGFYIGDGTTSTKTGSVSFINTSRNVIQWNMNFFKTYFTPKLKYTLVYGPTKPNKHDSRKIIKFWKEIGISKFSWSINEKYINPSEFGAMRISSINMALKLIVLKSLIKISKIATRNPTIAKFFLKGLAMSDMYPSIKNGVLESISIAFKAGDINLMRLYSQIFDAYGIKVKPNSKKIENTTALCTYRMKDFIKMLIDNIFEFHELRKQKLIKGILNMKLFSIYLKRLKVFLEGPLTAYEFSLKSKLLDVPYKQLDRLIEFGLIGKTNTYPRLYIITDRGIEFLNRFIQK